jgi:abortive infection bacteriophage resistance protein
MTFSKPALSVPNQRLKLEGRGLVIPDVDRAERYLATLGYYRFSAYTRPFQHDHSTHAFHPDVTFDDVLNLYIFDRQLRLTLLDALERIEVALRTRINDTMCDRTANTHWYTNAAHFRAQYDHSRLLREVRDHKDDFVTSYQQNYISPADLPSWMAMQALSFGAVQKVLLNLKRREKQAICHTFGLDAEFMVTWVYALATLRNHCAHHARTWNRTFHVNLPLTNTAPSQLRGQITAANHNTLDGYALILDVFMQHVSPGSHWWSRLEKLVQDYHDATPHAFHQTNLQHRAGHLVTP